jgi:hypothetical protein
VSRHGPTHERSLTKTIGPTWLDRAGKARLSQQLGENSRGTIPQPARVDRGRWAPRSSEWVVTSEWTVDIRIVLASLRFKLMAHPLGFFSYHFLPHLHFVVHIGFGMPRKSAQ